jgi:hypothetical protein
MFRSPGTRFEAALLSDVPPFGEIDVRDDASPPAELTTTLGCAGESIVRAHPSTEVRRRIQMLAWLSIRSARRNDAGWPIRAPPVATLIRSVVCPVSCHSRGPS